MQRLVCIMDTNNKNAVQDYMKTFNLEAPLGDKTKGVLALEFEKETVGEDVTGVLRIHDDEAKQIYRWGRADLTRNEWWQKWIV